jgi:hypothetical protein
MLIFPIYYTVLSKILIVDTIFLQIPFTYVRNCSGPNTLPCGNIVDALTLLQLSVYDKKGIPLSLPTLKSTPLAAIFVSSRSRGTKSKDFLSYLSYLC